MEERCEGRKGQESGAVESPSSFFSISPSSVQISMNAAATMEAVHTHAPTQMAHSSAAVELDTHWQRTEGVAVVSRFIEWDTSRVASPS